MKARLSLAAITRAFLPTPDTAGPPPDGRVPHEATRACVDDHCYGHDVDEPIPAGTTAYLICGECFHYYPTPGALVRDYRREALKVSYLRTIPLRELPAYLWHVATRRASKIYFCQHCLHDF